MKPTVAVMFGGRSVEHEISVITALQAIQAMDPFNYKIVPVYISLEGKWYTGPQLLDKAFYRGLPGTLTSVQEVFLPPDPTVGGLVAMSGNRLEGDKSCIPIDIAFVNFHGQFGEDGCIQGLLELAEIAYTGCNVTASAVAMNKYHCKVFLEAHGIPVLPSTVVTKESAIHNFSEARNKILQCKGLERFPLFVKPCHLGSSVGISKAFDVRSLDAALAKAFQYDDEAIIEPCVTNIMEINVSVLEGNPPIASVVEIPVASTGNVLSYEDKYMRGGKKTSGRSSDGMASLTRIIDPQQLPDEIKKPVIEYGLKAFSLLRCSGVGRFDFIFDKDRAQLYFNELNPIPGSLAFYLWEKSHPPLLYTEVLNRMLKGAQERRAQKLTLQRNFGFKALLS